MTGTGSGVAPADATPLLRTVKLTKHFRLGGVFSHRMLHAVDDLDLSVAEREIVAVVGESGSGKTTVARLLAKLYTPTSGDVEYRGRSLSSLRGRRDSLWFRGEVPMVFQDPYSAMNPVFRVSHGVMRGLALHRPDLSAADRRREAERAFAAVGLTPTADMLRKFPHEMSGGQRQRVGFAAALALRPRLILADEPVSMLDVSIRAGILNILASLRADQGVSIVYITHDIASARYVADRIMVMYAGHAVESGPADVVLSQPRHPYTQLLLAAVPDPRERRPDVAADAGEPPRVIDPPEGCRFRGRCPLAIDICATTTPRPRAMGPGHEAACHVASPDGAGAVPDAGAAAAPVASAAGALDTPHSVRKNP